MNYTFLMPAYKIEYLHDAIQSILDQTYRNFQLIISDDCSPYDIESIAKEFDDDRIIFRRNKINIGGTDLVKHWNLLLELADSEYVILSPDDDIYSSRFLEEIDKLIYKYPHCNVYKCRAQDVDEYGVPYKTDIHYPELITQTDDIKFQFCRDAISGIGQYVFRKESLWQIGGFVNYPVAWWSDVMTHIRLSANGMAVTKDILFSFRHFKGNISSHKSSATERVAKTKATLMFCEDIKLLMRQIISLTEKDNQHLCHALNDTKLKSIYSSASVTSLRDNLKLVKSNPDIFNSTPRILRLIRYWLTKSWLVDIVVKIRR